MADVAITTALAGVQQVQAGLKSLQTQVAGIGRTLGTTLPQSTRASTSAFTLLTRGLDNIGSGLQRAVGAVDRFENSLLSVRTVVGAVIGSAVVQQVLNYAQAWQNASVRIGQFATDAVQARAIQEALFQSAQRTGTAFTDTAEVFARFSPIIRDLGGSAGDTISIVDRLNKLVILSGANSIEASNAIRQLSQGFAAGTLRGDELRSVMEQFPGLLRIIADEQGKTVSELIANARESGIQIGIILNAIRNHGDEIDAQFERMGLTLSRALGQLENAFLRIVGGSTEATGATSELARGIKELADFLGSAAARRGADEFFGRLTADLGTFGSALSKLNTTFKEVMRGNFLEAAKSAGSFILTLDQIKVFGQTAGDAVSDAFGDMREAAIQQNAEIQITREQLGLIPEAAADAAEATLKGVQGVIKGLQDENQLLQLGARERAVQTAVINAQEAAIKNKTKASDEEIAKVAELAGRNYDLEQAETARFGKAKAGAAGIIAGLQKEIELVGMSARERAISEAVIDAENAAKEQGVQATAAEVAETRQLAGAAYDAAAAEEKRLEIGKQLFSAMFEGHQTVLQDLNQQLASTAELTREQFINIEVQKALQQALEERMPVHEREIKLIREKAGALYDQKDAVKSLEDQMNELAESEEANLTRAMATVMDTTFRWSSVLLDIHRSLQNLFVGLGRNLIGFVEGAKSATEVIKGFFEDLAGAILDEFARVAASEVFRALFFVGSPGGVPGGPAERAAGQQALAGATGAAPGAGLLGASIGLNTVGKGLIGVGAGGLTGGLVKQLTGGNKIAGGLSGALAGALTGFFLGGGPIGAIIGGLGGGLFGGFFQHGGDFITKGPQFIGVGEAGPERVTITPLSGGRGGHAGGGSNVNIHLGGVTVLDDMTMLQFERRIARAVGFQARRVV